MYTEDDIKKLFSKRGMLEMELRTLKAFFYKREDSINEETQEKMDQLERNLQIIDSFFCALSANEEFVIRLHVMDELDWPQILSKYIEKWNVDSEKSVRSLQMYQSKALKKIALVLNKSIGFSCIEIS